MSIYEQEIQVMFRSLTAQRLGELQSALQEILTGRLSEATRQAAARAAHNLAGSAAQFGYPLATPIANAVDRLLRQLGPISAPELQSLYDRLSAELPFGTKPGAAARAEHSIGMGVQRRRVLVVSPDEAVHSSMRLVGEGQAVSITSARSKDDAWSRLERERPDAAIVDLSGSQYPEDSFATIRQLRRKRPPVPVTVLTDAGAFEHRVKASRLGAETFLQKPLPPVDILGAALRTIDAQQEIQGVVLAVDDDPLVLRLLSEILYPTDMRLVTTDKAESFWSLLEEHQPDLVLLDVDMPDVDGVELCRLLRGDPRHQSVPVIFLTSFADPVTLREAFDAGADDFMSKPVTPSELLARMTARIERSRQSRLLADTDPLTGALNRRGVDELFQRLRGLASRRQIPLSLATIDLDRFKQVNDTYGHLFGDNILRRLTKLLQSNLRREDVVGRLGGEEFLILLTGTTKDDAARQLTEFMQVLQTDASLQSAAPTFSGGVAEYPIDGEDFLTLYQVADQYLYAAKAAGRALVLPAQPSADLAQRSVDVAVVEDDPAIATLVTRKLKHSGYSTVWYGSGEEACAALASARPAVNARVVVMDLRLPAMDGLAVLDTLRRSGVLRSTLVIMLSASGSDSDIRHSLQGGAFDYLTKPFRPSDLADRVTRALGHPSRRQEG